MKDGVGSSRQTKGIAGGFLEVENLTLEKVFCVFILRLEASVLLIPQYTKK